LDGLSRVELQCKQTNNQSKGCILTMMPKREMMMKMVMGDPTSTSVAMGQASNNLHIRNPNKKQKISHAIKKTTAI